MAISACQGPVAHPQHLREFRRDHQHRDALFGASLSRKQWTSAFVATSMPRVGSSTMSGDGFRPGGFTRTTPGIAAVDPEDSPRHFAPARADQAGGLVSGPVVATCVVARRPATGRYFDALPHSSPSGPTARLSGLSGCHPPNSCLSCPCSFSCPCLAANAAVYGVNHHVVAISQACAPCQSGDIPRSQVCPEKE